MAEDLLETGGDDVSDDELRHRCEVAIRNHDPCISCATHFLDLTVDRTEFDMTAGASPGRRTVRW